MSDGEIYIANGKIWLVLFLIAAAFMAPFTEYPKIVYIVIGLMFLLIFLPRQKKSTSLVKESSEDRFK